MKLYHKLHFSCKRVNGFAEWAGLSRNGPLARSNFGSFEKVRAIKMRHTTCWSGRKSKRKFVELVIYYCFNTVLEILRQVLCIIIWIPKRSLSHSTGNVSIKLVLVFLPQNMSLSRVFSEVFKKDFFNYKMFFFLCLPGWSRPRNVNNCAASFSSHAVQFSTETDVKWSCTQNSLFRDSSTKNLTLENFILDEY